MASCSPSMSSGSRRRRARGRTLGDANNNLQGTDSSADSSASSASVASSFTVLRQETTNVHASLMRAEKFLQQAACARLLRKTEYKAALAAPRAAEDALDFSEEFEKQAVWNHEQWAAQWQALPSDHRAAVEAEANHGPQSDDSSPSFHRMDGEDSDQDDEVARPPAGGA